MKHDGDPPLTPCVLLACFLPSLDKAYVIEEIFEALGDAFGPVSAYVGVQHGSHPEAERIISSVTSEWTVHMARVPERLHVDSDAAAYVEGLRLLRESGNHHSRCYFIHTKGITSNNDDLRRQLLGDLLDEGRVTRALEPRGVGSYGPHLTITRNRADISSMERWIHLFATGPRLPALPYFFAHTMWVAKGVCVTRFLRVVDSDFFETPIGQYSDRYFAERDLPHFVDMLSGLRPSYGRLAGNHSTHYQRTRTREYLRTLVLWHLRTAPSRLRVRVRVRVRVRRSTLL